MKSHHKYIEYLLKKLDKKYNKNIILFYNPKCIRTNITFNKEKNKHLFEYGDRLIENAIKEKKRYRDYLRYVVSHEMGHIYWNTNKYETLEEKTIAEYKAERFALNRLKKDYPKTYIWVCKEGYSMVHDKTWGNCESEKHYRNAWEKIKEYNS